MSLSTKYTNHIVIIILSIVFSIVRWTLMDKEFPLFGISKLQAKAIKIKELSNKELTHSIKYSFIKDIAENNIYPIIDARDFDSYNEGHIDNAINIDAFLIIDDGDEKEINKLNDFLNSNSSNNLIIYCWNPECDRAEYLHSYLIDLGSKLKVSIYEDGWDDWVLMEKNNNE